MYASKSAVLQILSLTFCIGACSSNDYVEVPVGKREVVLREYTNTKPVSKDLTSQKTDKRQAGAAYAEQEYSHVLAKRRYVSASDTDNEQSNSEDDNNVDGMIITSPTPTSTIIDKSVYVKE